MSELSLASKPDAQTSMQSPTPLLGNDYLTPEALAHELGTTKGTLIRWEVERIGPPRVKVGRRVFYRRTSVLNWLESRESNRRHRGSR